MPLPLNLSSEEIHSIWGALSKIIAEGLSNERRKAVLDGVIKTESQMLQESAIHLLLVEKYEKEKDFRFVVELARRIQDTQSFYRDVGPELDRLKYLIRKNELDAKTPGEKPYVFVLMPFQDDFFVVYEKAIKPRVEKLGCEIQHAKEVHHTERIVDVVFEKITKSHFLIADMTGRNPNVYYELGFAHARGKQVILITQDKGDFPFDVSGIRHIPYSPQGLNALASDIEKTALHLLGKS